MSGEKVVPILPCASIKETLEFYRALGFEVTYEQSRPNPCAGVRYNDVRLDFFVKKNWNPAFVYISVPDVDAVHEAFVRGTKQAYGRRLAKGTPRITSVNTLSSDRRFNVVDPGGNWLYIGQPLLKESGAGEAGETRLTRAVNNARTFAYSQQEPASAAKILEVAFSKNDALSKNDAEPAAVRFRAYVLRADVANELGDTETLEQYVPRARNVQLSEAERLELTEELERLAELENLLTEQPKPEVDGKGDS